MTPAARHVLLGAPFDPYRLGNNAAVYSLAGSASDLTWLIDGSNRLYYVADRSGNSAVNGLVLPGVASNSATAPDSAATRNATDVAVIATLDAWISASRQYIVSKWGAGGQRQYLFGMQTTGDATPGALRLVGSTDGTATAFTIASTVTVPVFAFGKLGIRFTRDAATGDVIFYTSSDDGSTWTKLGDTVSTAAGALFAGGASTLEIGTGAGGNLVSGIVWRVIVRSGIAGTIVFDANFTLAAKLATSFTESSSNAATVTINQTSIALPARIHGARDLYQGLTASMPTFSVSDGYNIATFDGTADCLKSAPLPLSQPNSGYHTASAVSWTSGDYVLDGGGTNGGAIIQTTSTPQINLNAGSSVAANTGWTVGARAVLSAFFNGASSALGVNLNTQTTGNAGAGTANGFTLGARGAGDANYGNITWSQTLLRSVADDTALSTRIIRYFMRLGGISG